MVFIANKNGSEEVDQTAVELKRINEPQLKLYTAVKKNKTSINLEITRRKLPHSPGFLGLLYILFSAFSFCHLVLSFRCSDPVRLKTSFDSSMP